MSCSWFCYGQLVKHFLNHAVKGVFAALITLKWLMAGGGCWNRYYDVKFMSVKTRNIYVSNLVGSREVAKNLSNGKKWWQLRSEEVGEWGNFFEFPDGGFWLCDGMTLSHGPKKWQFSVFVFINSRSKKQKCSLVCKIRVSGPPPPTLSQRP